MRMTADSEECLAALDSRLRTTWIMRRLSAITRGRYVLFANEGNVESTPERPIGNDLWLKLVEVNHRAVDG